MKAVRAELPQTNSRDDKYGKIEVHGISMAVDRNDYFYFALAFVFLLPLGMFSPIAVEFARRVLSAHTICAWIGSEAWILLMISGEEFRENLSTLVAASALFILISRTVRQYTDARGRLLWYTVFFGFMFGCCPGVGGTMVLLTRSHQLTLR